MENAIEKLIANPSGLGDQLEIKNFLDNFSDYSPLKLQSIVHLHGLITQAERGYVFSYAEYAKNIARPNSWMLTLVQLIRGEPFIVAGTSLDEIDVTYYLEHRNSNSTRGDLAPSILVEPYPDRLTQQLCENHELCLFTGTVLDFFSTLETRFGPAPAFWNVPPPKYLASIPVENRDKIAFETSFEAVPRLVAAETRIAPFLLGAPLTWAMLEARADIPRDVFSGIFSEIQRYAKDFDYRVFLLLDEPGSGKSALLRRLAYQLAKQERNVFFFTGLELIEEKKCAQILDALTGPCYIFVDDWADHFGFFGRILAELRRKDIIFVGTERTYRRPYIESGLSEDNFAIVESQLDLDSREAQRLIIQFQKEGLSSEGALAGQELSRFSRSIANNSISVAGCRIQNNFHAFDKIVGKLLTESGGEETRIYATVGVARYCYAGGVHRSVLYDAQPSDKIATMLDVYSPLPIVFADRAKQYIIPARSATADRAVSILHREDPGILSDVFVSLANAVAPRVNRDEIRKRAPAAKLAGALLDFDRLVRRFINEHAEYFYDQIKERWDWNSRYWEQCALLKLDRYLADKSNRRLLEEGIQNARYAYSIESHPLSLTTLAKLIFMALDNGTDAQAELFEEGWDLINQSIDIEANWANVKATAFVVCFNGVLSYLRAGGNLNGAQTERLRDVISITHRRNMRSPQLLSLREQVVAAAL